MRLDKERLVEALQVTDENTEYLNSILYDVSNEYLSSLDDIMKRVHAEILSSPIPAELDLVERYYLELANTLYFMYEKVEMIGIHDDISKALAKEVFNKAYLNGMTVDGGKKPTVNELTATAETASLHENAINTLYSRIYKILKSKIDAGYEMCRCLSKMMSRRMQEGTQTTIDTDTRLRLLEG